MVSLGACVACASVGLPPCGQGECLYPGATAPVSLARPSGRKASRRPGMPESAKLVAASTGSQKIGEFLDWLNFELGVTLCVLDDATDRFQPARGSGVFSNTEALLARYYGIDLARVERERGRLLAWIRAKGDT